MKHKLRILYGSLILLFSSCFLIQEFGSSGQLTSRTLRVHVLPTLRRISASFTDLKFKARGPVPPKSKIVIVDIDSASLEQIGRWPWRRDYTAWLIDRVFASGAKAVGLDIVFPERESMIPEELMEALRKKNLAQLAEPYHTDDKLAQTIRHYQSRLVMAWQTESPCVPLYSRVQECPLEESAVPQGFERFAISNVKSLLAPTAQLHPRLSPLTTAIQVIGNISPFNEASLYQGFVNADRDADGVIRRNNALMKAGAKLYPSIALELARLALNEEIEVKLDRRERVDSLRFAKSGRSIPISGMGLLETNFRGPDRSFSYLSARDVLSESDTIKDQVNRKLAGLSRTEVLKDAVVLIGVSALAVGDIIATPYADSMPGVEVHATVLDNLLSDDFLVSQSSVRNRIALIIFILLVMIIGGFGVGFVAERLEAKPAIGLFAGVLLLLAFVDTKVLFNMNQNWNTSFFFLEMIAVMCTVLFAKYILEEREKRFIKVAMGKYVSNSVVDLIMKDARALELGGHRKEVSILFSDIRGFTSFSETMDASTLSNFLNEYLGIMTKVIFECGGTIDKFIGDAIMAFFGAPVDQVDHAAQACRAAILMQQKVAEHRKYFKEKYGVIVEIGVGLNSGVVSVGNMGTESKFDYTVIGDQVNLASRVESATKQYGVNILTTHFTLGIIQERNDIPPIYRVVDLVKVKGKREAVQLIELSSEGWSEDGLGIFEEAREHYRYQEWDQAIEKFTRASALLHRGVGTGETDRDQDSLCSVYVDRCKNFKRQPPEKDWDGSWYLDSK